MAVQVARLRLFIAIIAAESAADAGITPPPLPNLEAKIVCADTLATVAAPEWTPFSTGTLAGAQVTQVNATLAQVAKIREQWQSAHDEPSKAALRQQDETARRDLRNAIPGRIVNLETAAFAEHPLLDPDAPPAQTDPRLLFYSPQRKGFDIVIGNPPYESVNKDLQAPPNASKAVQRELNQQRRARRRHLTDQKRYRTTAGNDLYNLIAEAGLALAKPDGGVVELVVPLSLCFGQDQHDLRRLFEERCKRISLRCQDIRADIMCSTTARSPIGRNAQRTAIVTATTGVGTPNITNTGTNRWRKSERHANTLQLVPNASNPAAKRRPWTSASIHNGNGYRRQKSRICCRQCGRRRRKSGICGRPAKANMPWPSRRRQGTSSRQRRPGVSTAGNACCPLTARRIWNWQLPPPTPTPPMPGGKPSATPLTSTLMSWRQLPYRRIGWTMTKPTAAPVG